MFRPISGDVEENFFQDIRPSLSTRGLVVNRNYLRVPIANRSNYQDVTNNYLRELSDEKVQMYRIEVLQNAHKLKIFLFLKVFLFWVISLPIRATVLRCSPTIEIG
jgi:hypothetical protein